MVAILVMEKFFGCDFGHVKKKFGCDFGHGENIFGCDFGHEKFFWCGRDFGHGKNIFGCGRDVDSNFVLQNLKSRDSLQMLKGIWEILSPDTKNIINEADF